MVAVILALALQASAQKCGPECTHGQIVSEQEEIEKDLFKYGAWPWYYSQGQSYTYKGPNVDPALEKYKGKTNKRRVPDEK